MMDNMGLHDLLWIAATGLIAFFVKAIWSKIETLDKEMKEVSMTYVRREDYRDDIRDIKDMLGKIFDRLETKADK
jgi:flagellar motor component MotA